MSDQPGQQQLPLVQSDADCEEQREDEMQDGEEENQGEQGGGVSWCVVEERDYASCYLRTYKYLDSSADLINPIKQIEPKLIEMHKGQIVNIYTHG